jgi:hypothetical protein
MTSSPQPPLTQPLAWSRRLADQLQLLSELTENLTFRLLEAEEQLAAQELQLRTLLESGAEADPALAAELDLRLGDTEARLARIEAVLNGPAEPDEARHLRAVDVRSERFSPAPQDREEEEEPFLEEGEQPFMDELIA